MNISLFSQNLLFAFCILATILTTAIFLKTDARLRKKGLIVTLVSSITLAFILQLVVLWLTQAGKELPTEFLLMFTPFTYSLCLIGILLVEPKLLKRQEKAAKKRKTWKPAYNSLLLYSASGLNVLLCLCFGLLLINDYYHYYPTLNTVFGIGMSRASVLSAENKISLQFGSQRVGKINTIEGSIFGSNTSLNGKVYRLTIPGTVSGFKPRTGWIYLPAIAEDSTALLKLPVLVMLSGIPGSPADLINSGDIVKSLNSFANTHHGITPIVYLADDAGSAFNDTECVNSPRGNVETYLSVDVPRFIKAHFNTSTNPANWGIGGISMGGTCSVILTLRHPNVYHYFDDIGGEVGPEIGSEQKTVSVLFGGSVADYNQHLPLKLLAENKYPNTGGFLANGENDSPRVVIGTQDLYNATRKAGLDTIHFTINGQHTYTVFSKLLNYSIPWMSNRLGATQCTLSIVCDN